MALINQIHGKAVMYEFGLEQRGRESLQLYWTEGLDGRKLCPYGIHCSWEHRCLCMDP